MITFIKQNKILTLGLAIVVFGIVYYVFFMQKSDVPLLSTTDTTGASAQSQELLAILASLRTIRLDGAIFTDPVYLSLTDFGVTIPPQTAGRANPFAPTTATARAGTSTQTITLPPTRALTLPRAVK